MSISEKTTSIFGFLFVVIVVASLPFVLPLSQDSLPHQEQSTIQTHLCGGHPNTPEWILVCGCLRFIFTGKKIK